MNDEQFRQFLEHQDKTLKEGIETHVNGKIRSLTTKFDEYVKDDTQWKADVTPYIENMKKISGFTSIGATILKAIMLIGGAVGVIYALLVFIKSWIISK